jgi:serine/threonine protein kinase
MEYADGGDLHAYMREKQSLSEKQARWLFQQVQPTLDMIANTHLN